MMLGDPNDLTYCPTVGDNYDVGDVEKCISNLADKTSLVAPQEKSESAHCLFLHTGKYCDGETYSMDFNMDGEHRTSTV